MDFKYDFLELKRKADFLAEESRIALEKYQSACDFTSKFLDICKDARLDKVSIGKKHESVPSSMDWCFGASGSVFAMGKDKHGWPSIWGVVEKAGISGGCGNSDQHQVNDSNLVDGVYHLKDGKWLKVD